MKKLTPELIAAIKDLKAVMEKHRMTIDLRYAVDDSFVGMDIFFGNREYIEFNEFITQKNIGGLY